MVELQMKIGEEEKLNSLTTQFTFQPILIADSSAFQFSRPFQERNNTWNLTKQKNLAYLSRMLADSEDDKEIKECTFHP